MTRFSAQNLHWLGLVLMVVSLGYVAYLAMESVNETNEQNQRTEAAYQLGQVINRLSAEFAESVQIGRGSTGLIAMNPDLTQKEFAVAAEKLIQSNPGIINLALAPDLVIRMIYPVAGNERVLGVDYRDVPAQLGSVKRAIESRRMVVSGPLELLQGGQGIILRIPVWLNPYVSQKFFWGIISVVVDVDSLMRSSGVFDLLDKYDVAVLSGSVSNRIEIFGDASLEAQDPVVSTFSFEGGNWLFLIRPKGGWTTHQGLSDFNLLLVLLCLLVLAPATLLQLELKKRRTAEKNLRDKNEQQERLFSIVAHELRTPASAIKMIIDEQAEMQRLPKGELLHETVDHLMTVLDDMRIVVRPEEAAKGKISNTVIPQLIDSCLYLLETTLRDAGIRAELRASEESKLSCRTNVPLLRQIILNLIRNAAIHSGASELSISVNSSRLPSDELEYLIEFSDDGRGVAAKYRDKIFDAFERAESEVDGSGLGLHISQRFAREHFNGDLTYAENPRGGATFTLRLVLKSTDATEDEIPRTSTESNPLDGLRILLAEDNKVLQITIVKLLEKQGASVDLAENGSEALKRYRANSYDLLISDIFMPEMDGYQLVTEVRKLDTRLPVIGLTAAVIGTETERMLECGANTVLAKPLIIDQLKQSLVELGFKA